jgi:SAM-dependent methyltransferase
LFEPSAYHALFYADPAPSPNQRESLAWMRPHLPDAARLLDFGCANGAFMTLAAGGGYRVKGIEQNPTAIAFAREHSGLDVASLEAMLEGDARFDAIHIADVLSHLPNPAELLRSLETLLAPGGLFVIEGPLEKQHNLVFLSLLAGKRAKRLLGRDREGDHPPVHLTFSSWKSQEYFFRQVMHYAPVALDLHEDGWPFLAPGTGRGVGAKQLIGSAALALSKSPLARPLGAFNRFRVVLRPELYPAR